MPDFDHIELTSVVVGGKRVGFTKSTRTIHLAGDDIPVESWLEVRRRIDMLMKRGLKPEDWKALREKIAWLGKRDRLPAELRDYEAAKATATSVFIDKNWREIGAAKRGRMVKAPWCLRWLYDWVVTKESYGN